MSESGSILSQRSSSQTSRNSSDSKKTRTMRSTLCRSDSKSSETPSHRADPSLTSFPSFSPEQAKNTPDPSVVPSQPVLNRTTSQKTRDRKATLAGLTNASPSINQGNALFDDSPRVSIDTPGALHLASDEHIVRLIARAGALKLVRQFARDLAQRDGELSALRTRADNRERELKRLLRETDVASAEIEKRLLKLEQGPAIDDLKPGMIRPKPTTINSMMEEAMSEDVGQDGVNDAQGPSIDRVYSDGILSPKSGVKSTKSRNEQAAGLGMWNSTASSRKTSRTNSILSQEIQDAEATVKQRSTGTKSSRVRGLESVFSPPSQSSSYFIGGSNKTVKAGKSTDAASVRSNESGSSFTSWTKMFAGNAQSRKTDTRPRSSSLAQDNTKTSAGAADSMMAALSKVRTNPAKESNPRPLSGTVKGKPQARRTPTTPSFPPTSDHARKPPDLQSLGPVEMDAILPDTQRPPTMTHTYQKSELDGVLTDRFGFIFDQRHRKRQSLAAIDHKNNRLSASETLGNFRKAGSDDGIGSGLTVPKTRPDTPASIASADEDSKKPWQDYLKISNHTGRPTELLSHTPSARAIITVSAADSAETGSPTPLIRGTSLSVGPTKSPPTTSLVSETNVTASTTDHQVSVDTADKELVKLLLEQLTELHDSLQAEKEVKWHDFLRRVRAERANNAVSSASGKAANAPEAALLDGELIGIATLGRSKETKNKYLAFKSLVLSGIPVSLRPKIWAECSGATSLRIPGYYEDLVARSEKDGEVDPDIASQIAADIRRTLTDNTFFRHGPGVQRLEELLRAYSLHHPQIGYCQGMNLITASLLLICATAEDCFWLLVAIIDHILPSGYFDQSLLVARADQIVLRQYVAEVLPKLDAKLTNLGVELEALTFQWFLSLYSGVLTGGEALYRVWDVVLCLNSSEEMPQSFQADTDIPQSSQNNGESSEEHAGTTSPFLFQLSLALLKLNESQVLALDSAAMVYTYVNHNMTNHAISIDGLVQGAEALRVKVKRRDVLERRRAAVKEIGG